MFQHDFWKSIFLLELPRQLRKKWWCLGLFLELLVCFIGSHVSSFHQYTILIIIAFSTNFFLFKIILAILVLCVSVQILKFVKIYTKYTIHFWLWFVELRDQLGVNLNLNDWVFWPMNMACLKFISYKFHQCFVVFRA